MLAAALLALLAVLPTALADVYCGTTCGNGNGWYTPTGCAACACCAQCPPGAYCRNTDVDGTTDLCPAGSANPDYGGKTLNAACKGCAPGTNASTPGSAVCSPCPANTFINATGEATCTDCAAGTFSGAGALLCCAAGRWSNADSGSCTACAAGSACPPGASAPTQCAAGTFSARLAASCTACDSGLYSSAGAGTCCAAGAWSATGSTKCTNCTAGYYCPPGATARISCPVGAYCPAQAPAAIACPAGTYNYLTGGKGSDACLLCEADHISGAGSAACTLCPAVRVLGAPLLHLAQRAQNLTHATPLRTLAPGKQQGTYSPEGSSKCSVNGGFAFGCAVLGFASVLMFGRLFAPTLFGVSPTAPPEAKPFLPAP